MNNDIPLPSEKLEPKQIEFAEWLATPRNEREIKTQQALAKAWGLHRDTLTNWKNKPELREYAARLSRAAVLHALPDIYKALVRTAKKGDVPAIKLALEMAGEYTSKQQVEHSGTMTWAQIVEQANASE